MSSLPTQLDNRPKCYTGRIIIRIESKFYVASSFRKWVFTTSETEDGFRKMGIYNK